MRSGETRPTLSPPTTSTLAITPLTKTRRIGWRQPSISCATAAATSRSCLHEEARQRLGLDSAKWDLGRDRSRSAKRARWLRVSRPDDQASQLLTRPKVARRKEISAGVPFNTIHRQC